MNNYYYKYLKYKNKYINNNLKIKYGGYIHKNDILNKIISIGFEFETPSIVTIKKENNIPSFKKIIYNINKNIINDYDFQITNDVISYNNSIEDKIFIAYDILKNGYKFNYNKNDYEFLKGYNYDTEFIITYYKPKIDNDIILKYFTECCRDINNYLLNNNNKIIFEDKINNINIIENNDYIIILNKKLKWQIQTTLCVNIKDFNKLVLYLLDNENDNDNNKIFYINCLNYVKNFYKYKNDIEYIYIVILLYNIILLYISYYIFSVIKSEKYYKAINIRNFRKSFKYILNNYNLDIETIHNNVKNKIKHIYEYFFDNKDIFKNILEFSDIKNNRMDNNINNNINNFTDIFINMLNYEFFNLSGSTIDYKENDENIYFEFRNFQNNINNYKVKDKEFKIFYEKNMINIYE